MIEYHIEKHTVTTWKVTARQDGSPLRRLIAECPSQGIALTIKGMYEKEEDKDNG